MKLTYCIPSEAGLASEGPAVGRRIARLLKATCDEVNAFVVDGRGPGTIEHDVYKFRTQMIEKLVSEGWRIKARESGGYSVLVPKGYLDGAYSRKGEKS